MNFISIRTGTICFAVSLAMVTFPAVTFGAIDEAAAQALLKKNECFKCHAIDKKKDGTPYKEVAKKYKGKADAEDKLFTHVTSKPMVEVDGKKEEHKAMKASDPAAIRNAVQWILSL